MDKTIRLLAVLACVVTTGCASVSGGNVQKMDVQAQTEAGAAETGAVASATRGAMYGNLIMGGVVGAVIDHSSGAAYEHPEMIKVTMGRMISMDVPKQPISGTRDPNTCAREGRTCWLYAVDDQVVWTQDVKHRIGRSDQLGPHP